MSKMQIAVQLYTLRDQIAKDFPAILKDVAKIGYAGVELAGYGNLKSAKEVKKAIDDVGLKIVGNHCGIDQFEADANKVMDENEFYGNKNLCIPWMPEERRKDAAGWKTAAKTMENIGKTLAPRGFNLAYHNHSFEFEKFGGKTGMDILWSTADPKLLRSELDTYWVQHGGADPVAYINMLGSRILLLHLKDMAKGPEKKFAPVGTGILDFPKILDAGNKAGVKWGIVEQDDCYGTAPIEAIRTSFNNLKKIGAV